MAKSKKSSEKKIKVTLMLSKFGRKTNHAECVRGLGLRSIRDSVILEDTAAIRGMINKVSYLLKIEEV